MKKLLLFVMFERPSPWLSSQNSSIASCQGGAKEVPRRCCARVVPARRAWRAV